MTAARIAAVPTAAAPAGDDAAAVTLRVEISDLQTCVGECAGALANSGLDGSAIAAAALFGVALTLGGILMARRRFTRSPLR